MNIDHKTPLRLDLMLILSRNVRSNKRMFAAKGCNWGPIWGPLGQYAKKVLNEKQLPKMEHNQEAIAVYNRVGELFHRGYGGIPSSR